MTISKLIRLVVKQGPSKQELIARGQKNHEYFAKLAKRGR